MHFLLYLSDWILPMVIFYIVANALVARTPCFDSFTKGAKQGFSVVVDILPTLVGLMVATGLLRASGVLDVCANALAPLVSGLAFPAALVPMVIVKLLSSSAATSLLLDIFREFGPDSYEGFLASVIMSSTETIFYTMAVYFAAAKVSKTRYTLTGALLSTLTGIVVATLLVSWR